LSEKIEALTAATLGALQGLTEFLPVSSSGHVAIGAHLFDIRENSLALVILLHLGALMAERPANVGTLRLFSWVTSFA
jgi:undecaprenyl-diphosphatase